jgi:CubicO group peptidase (beta-lactamase class C family)
MLSGGGGLYSTARDYLAFARALLRPGFLHAATLEAMRAPHVLGASGGRIPGVGCAMGLGVRVVRDPTSGYGPRGAFGWDGLAGTTFMVDPAGDVAVVCMTQVIPWPTGLHEAVRGATFA